VRPFSEEAFVVKTLQAWRDYGVQVPGYADFSELSLVTQALRRLPPLVTREEVDRLRSLLAEVQNGQKLVLMGGDCAESFERFSVAQVRSLLDVLDESTAIVSRDSKRETFWILRKAGQFAKPRSSATEIVGDMRLESFRGDIVNERRPDPRGRSPNPIRMAHAYGQALVTLELARQWRAASHRDRFVPIAHEALLLPYDLALTATGDDNNAASWPNVECARRAVCRSHRWDHPRRGMARTLTLLYWRNSATSEWLSSQYRTDWGAGIA
jgi:3-deoxy-D-arabino-heptulosonate 7-phosphate (DAHP) synthase class II